MNPDALGQFIDVTFMPHVGFIAGAVIALTVSLLFFLVIRNLLIEDDSSNA